MNMACLARLLLCATIGIVATAVSVFAPSTPAKCPVSKYSIGFVDIQVQVGWRSAQSRWADWIAIDRVAGSPDWHDMSLVIWSSSTPEPERFARLAGEVAEAIDLFWHTELPLREANFEYLNAVRSGFPIRCAIGWVEYRAGQRRPMHLLGDTSVAWWRCKPSRLLSIPFLLNVLIYACITHIVWIMPFLLRRFLSRKRTGQNCLACGYDLSGLIGEHCPECGRVAWVGVPPVDAAR